MNKSEELYNATVIATIVSKFPVYIRQEWSKHKISKKVDEMTSEDHFNELMDFLKSQKDITKDLMLREIQE